MKSVLIEIVVDCADPPRLARWWSEVLGGWPVTDDPRGLSWISASGSYDQLPILVFVPVPEAKAGKNRVHFDVSPSGADQAAELERLLGLGATRADVGQTGEEGFVVLADPEGNEFCLLGRRVDL